jgi:hypothetical protein
MKGWNNPMPCYTANLMSVEFTAENAKMLETAIKELGWVHQTTARGFRVKPSTKDGQPDYARAWSDGWIEIDTTSKTAEAGALNRGRVNLLKREYSRQVLQLACKQKGWIYRPTVTTAGQEQTTGKIVRY